MDKELSQLAEVMKIGDRIALKRFCSDAHAKSTVCKPQSQVGAAMRTRRQSLIERLRKDVGLVEDGDSLSASTSRQNGLGNTNASKNNRRIQVGWIHNNRQVRDPKGGGVRKLAVDKDATRDVLLEVSKGLFFREGTSRKGLKIDDCEAYMRDFSNSPLEGDVTVGMQYKQDKPNGMLRFYLNTKSVRDVCGNVPEKEDELEKKTPRKLNLPYLPQRKLMKILIFW